MAYLIARSERQLSSLPRVVARKPIGHAQPPPAEDHRRTQRTCELCLQLLTTATEGSV
jgi:hypothetical protein